MTDDAIDRDKVWKDFAKAVNMTPAALEKWLATEDSKSVGWTEKEGTESVGHHSGRRIVAIKHKTKSDMTEDDFTHMRKVVGYVHRHLAQGGPKQDVEHSAWRYSLMNWGHDPLEK
ncbi:DUF3140 domain-containing protein [Pararhizobium sp. PWRC1-1]|uniref:DUF3140 domain-containing protein n=1 Tax=Pararhizobium sp. PWRC1-1 TaxID=2804566 RepID=UPI003CED1F2A